MTERLRCTHLRGYRSAGLPGPGPNQSRAVWQAVGHRVWGLEFNCLGLRLQLFGVQDWGALGDIVPLSRQNMKLTNIMSRSLDTTYSIDLRGTIGFRFEV